MMIDDIALVRQYAKEKSEEAFATLVSRHVDLVYSVALRHVRDTHLAEEITQTVFFILARKARSLNPNTIVSGWLCRTARYASAKALVMERRRQHREQEACMQSELNETESNPWVQIAPLLDSAMEQLGQKDHDAVVLRFFEGRSFKDVSVALGTSEAGAKMRVQRALERLRRFFTKRGLTFSAAAIAGAISIHSVQAAPIELATSVTVTAFKGTVVTTSTSTLIQTTLRVMAWTKLKTAAVVGAIAIMTAGTATFTLQHAHRTAERSPFKFAGYGTPEASLQSILWAASKGDLEKLPVALTPEEMARFQSRMRGKTDEEVRHALAGWANAMSDYKITRKESISNDEVRLHIHATPSAEALHSGKAVIIMNKNGNEWKQAGEV